MAAQSHSPISAHPLASPSPPDRAAQLLLVVTLAERGFAVPVGAVERILRMAALTPLPDARPGIVGVLNVRGAILPVVDPRPRLGLPTPAFHPDQHLVVLAASSRYLLWIDRAEAIESAPAEIFDTVEGAGEQAIAPLVVRLAGRVLPVLAPEALDPGPIVQPEREDTR
jgi:chemotaxis signal transduction protein